MNRRHLVPSAFLTGIAAMLPLASVVTTRAQQSPEASPQAFPDDADQPVDPRARQLVARLSQLSPLAVLEALEQGDVTEPGLTSAGGGVSVTARPWNDPLDTDLEHALGGVLIVASDHPVHSPDLVTLGAFIVFESAVIAYDHFTGQLDASENVASMTVGGTKAWIAESDGMQLALIRLGYVLLIARESLSSGGVAKGLVIHLDELTQPMI